MKCSNVVECALLVMCFVLCQPVPPSFLFIFRYPFRLKMMTLKKMLEELLDEYRPSFETITIALDGM